MSAARGPFRRMGRRDGVLAGVALLVTGPPAVPGGKTALAALAAGLGPVGPLGRACRAALPAVERDPMALAAALLERLEAGLGVAVRQDFAAGRTRVVAGWLLADTEVRLMAWAAGIAECSDPDRCDRAVG